MAKSFRVLNSPEFKSQLSSFGNAVTTWTWKPGRKKERGAEERKNGADTGEGDSQKCTLRTMARILKWFAIPFSRGLLLSELSTMTCLSWVALHDMAHSFIELDKAKLLLYLC